MLISNPLVVGSSDRRVERLLKTINLQPNLSRDVNLTNRTSTFLSKAGTFEVICQWHHLPVLEFRGNIYSFLSVVDEVWKQQTLLQLLQIVEVPVLDCILTPPDRVHLRASETSAQDLVISNTFLERELSGILNLTQWVLFLMSNLLCTTFLGVVLL